MEASPTARAGRARTRVFRIAVTALLAESYGEVLGFAGRGGDERRRLGRALHAAYQEREAARDPSFRAELALAAELRHAGWRVLLHGRADALRRGADGVPVLQELKSLLAEREPSAEARAAARLQAALYAWLWERSRGEAARAEVLWLEPGAGGPRLREPAGLGSEAAEAALRRLLGPVLSRRAALEERRAAQRRAAGALRFPHPAPRPGQERLVAAVERALAEGEHLLVEAPAGLGKTIAALLPALRFGLATGRRVVWLTGRRTQRRAVRSALASLSDALPPGVAVALRARADLCANDRLACHPAACRFAEGYAGKRSRAGHPASALAEGVLLEPDALLAAGRAAEICPFELGLDAASEAPLVVCDWNHALDPERAVAPFAGERGLEDAVVVVDELHGLAERARAQQSAALEPELLEAASEEAELGGAPVHGEQAAVCAEAGALAAELAAEALPAEGGDATVEQRLPAERLRALAERAEAAFGAGLAYRAATRALDGPDAFAPLPDALARLADAAEGGGEESAQLVERRAGRVRLRVVRLDPSAALRVRLRHAHAVVGLSATLAPAWLHRDLCGLDRDRSVHVRVPDPFPPERRRVVIDARIDTRERRRTSAAPRVARRLAALASAVPGHTLALLPSYAWLGAVADALPPFSGRVLRQRAEQGDAEREALAAALGGGAPPALLLAVAGGALAEGVEFPGGALRAIAVVGPCLPPPDPERELLAARLEERFGAGFEAAYAAPGMRRVVQGGGRLLRSEEDRGVVALFGRRFLRAPYRDLLPEAWLRGEPPEALAGDPVRAAAAFFEGERAPPRPD